MRGTDWDEIKDFYNKTFGAVLARLFKTIKWDSAMAELDIAKLITGLLIEVDPAGFIDHEAYLPSEQKTKEKDKIR